MFIRLEEQDVHYLSGWEEIRAALVRVQEARESGQDVKIAIMNSNVDTILKFTLRTIDELEKYLKSTLHQMILQGASEDSCSVMGKIILQ
ncbi:hypothetical protein EU527_16755 [Candidatus Thorarchaeota archaeon]|nr:MAG: hypothetical protein EU527_16755 [Candidatus Thorarchaeota archaeon]